MKKLIFLLGLLSLQLHAAQEWVVNKDHSELFFSISYLNVSEVTGRFSDFQGSAQFDDKGSVQGLDIQVQVSSLNTENRLRDGHLKAPDFLNIRLYPVITFVAREISTSDGKTFLAKGDLNLHGVTRKQNITFELTPSLKDSWGYDNRFAKFSFSIKRKDFALEWNKTLAENKYLVGDEIQIRGSFQLQPINSLTPGSKHLIPVTSFTRAKERLKRGEMTQEEFNKTYLPEVPSRPEPQDPVLAPRPLPTPVAPQVVQAERSLNWWLSLGTLGLFGFFASIIIGFYAKHQLLEFFPKKYSEGGVLGNLGDLLVVGFTIIYSIAFWYVGWGK